MLIVFRLLAVLLLRLARVFTVAFLLLLLFRYDLLLTRLELLALPQVARFKFAGDFHPACKSESVPIRECRSPDGIVLKYLVSRPRRLGAI